MQGQPELLPDSWAPRLLPRHPWPPGPSSPVRLRQSQALLWWVARLPYHGRQAGDVFDRVLHFLLGHLDQRAVLVLRRQRLGPVPRDPGVQLQRRTGGVRGRCGCLPEGPASERSTERRRACGRESRGLRPGMRELGVRRTETGTAKTGTGGRRGWGACGPHSPSGPGSWHGSDQRPSL